MSKLIITILIVLALALGFIVYKQDQQLDTSKRDQQLYHKIYDSLNTQFLRTSMERDTYRHLVDSANSVSQDLVVELDKTKRALKAIPGRYKEVQPDSLAIIMNRRASEKSR
jgi:uncharacterized protein HemX